MGILTALSLAAIAICYEPMCHLRLLYEPLSGIIVQGRPIESYSPCTPPVWEFKSGAPDVWLVVTVCPPLNPPKFRPFHKPIPPFPTQ